MNHCLIKKWHSSNSCLSIHCIEWMLSEIMLNIHFICFIISSQPQIINSCNSGWFSLTHDMNYECGHSTSKSLAVHSSVKLTMSYILDDQTHYWFDRLFDHPINYTWHELMVMDWSGKDGKQLIDHTYRVEAN